MEKTIKIYKEEIHTVKIYREIEVPVEDFEKEKLDPNKIDDLKEFIKEFENEYDWEEIDDKPDFWWSSFKGGYPFAFYKDKKCTELIDSNGS